jgi:TRAP-type C4-dicarboxylate transport system substrate-binding protein
VPSVPFFALAGQFDTVAKHMLDVKWVPATGAAVITKKVWDQLSAPGRDALRAAGDAAGVKVRDRARQEDQEAIAAMKSRGLVVHPVTPELEADWRRMAEGAYPKLRGTMVPAEMFDQVRAIVAEYRKQHAK